MFLLSPKANCKRILTRKAAYCLVKERLPAVLSVLEKVQLVGKVFDAYCHPEPADDVRRSNELVKTRVPALTPSAGNVTKANLGNARRQK